VKSKSFTASYFVVIKIVLKLVEEVPICNPRLSLKEWLLHDIAFVDSN